MSENKKLVPKRRFKEFQNANAWEECELGEVVFVNSGRDYKHLGVGNIPVYGTGGYMLSVNNKLSDEDAVGIGRKGSIDNPQYLRAPFWTVDTLFFLTPKEEMNLRFFYAMAQGIKWRQFDESTGVPSLSKVNIEKITKNFPKIEEQEIIGQFFKNLDQTIAFQQRKLEKMKSMKSAYLSEMFPAEGERKPKRRFPGFTDDWEQRELGKVMNVTSVKRIRQSDWTDNGIRFLRARDIVSLFKNEAPSDVLYISKDRYEEYTKISGKVSQGDLLVTGVGSIGIPLLISSDNPLYFKDGNIIWFKNENRIDGNFFYYSFTGNRIQKFIKDVAGTGTVGTYTIDSGKRTPIYLPTEDEQKQIGSFFQNLDQTIAFQQQKLEKLQNIKKAYLNEMFI